MCILIYTPVISILNLVVVFEVISYEFLSLFEELQRYATRCISCV